MTKRANAGISRVPNPAVRRGEVQPIWMEASISSRAARSSGEVSGKYAALASDLGLLGSPYGIRTRAATLRGWSEPSNPLQSVTFS
jgi:hypothetical protein